MYDPLDYIRSVTHGYVHVNKLFIERLINILKPLNICLQDVHVPHMASEKL